MQTADVDLLDIDPLGLVEDEPVWSARNRSLEHQQGRHDQQDHAGGDKLGLAKRIRLGDGERLVGSASYAGANRGDATAVVGVIDSPGGRKLRLGVVIGEDAKRWSGANLGATVELDEAGISELDENLSAVHGLAKDAERELRELMAWRNENWHRFQLGNHGKVASYGDLSPTERATADRFAAVEWAGFEEGVLASGPWGELRFEISPHGMDEDIEDAGVSVDVHVKPVSAGDDWAMRGDTEPVMLNPTQVQKLQRLLGGMTSGGRSMEAFAVMASSPAVRLMMLARALEADDSFLRSGKMVTVNRGKGGKFAKKGVGDAVDAITGKGWAAGQGVKLDPAFKMDPSPFSPERMGLKTPADAPKKPTARRSAVAKALASGDPNALDGMGREALRREAKARGLEPRRGVSVEELRDMLWDDENAGSDQDAGGSGPRTISTQDSTPEENAIAIMGGRNVWRLESPEQQAAALKTTASRTAKRQRSHSNPAPHTIQSMDSTPEENAIAIMGGRNVWQEMRAGSGGANGGSPQAPGVRSIADQIDAIRANPSGGRAKMNALLEPLSHKELDALAAHYGLQKDIRGTKKQKRDTLTQIKVGFLADGAALDGGGNGNASQGQASATSPPAPIARVRAPRSRGAGPTPETQAEIAAIIAAPARGDREKLRGIFNSLTIPQLKKWAADNGYIYDPTGPKSQQVGRLVEHTIGFQLNSAAIRGTDWSIPTPSAQPARSTRADIPVGSEDHQLLSGRARDLPAPGTSQAADSPSRGESAGVDAKRQKLAQLEAAAAAERDLFDATRIRHAAEDLRREIGRIERGDDRGRVDQPREVTKTQIVEKLGQLLSRARGQYISLVQLRASLPHVKHDEVTAALKELDRARVIQLDPDSNQKAIPLDAYESAVTVGGERKLLVSLINSR